MEKPLRWNEYDGKGDMDEHMQLMNDWINYYNTDKASKCKLLALTLVGPISLILGIRP